MAIGERRCRSDAVWGGAGMSPLASLEIAALHKGRMRTWPVWILRLRLGSGLDTRRVLGRVWTSSTSVPDDRYLTEHQALAAARDLALTLGGPQSIRVHRAGLTRLADVRPATPGQRSRLQRLSTELERTCPAGDMAHGAATALISRWERDLERKRLRQLRASPSVAAAWCAA